MRSLLLVLSLIFSGCNHAQTPYWDMVNVNKGSKHGDAHLWVDDVNVLIDAGQLGQAQTELVPHLKAQGITQIEYFVISHPHYDHFGGIVAVLDAGIVVKNVIYNKPPQKIIDCCFYPELWAQVLSRLQSHGANFIDVKKGDTFSTGKTEWEIINAPKSHDFGDLNDLSIVMTAKVGDVTTLFTGDLNHSEGLRLSASKEIKADILKVPHHGGYGIAPKSFFSAVNPTLMMFPSPAWVNIENRGQIAFGYAQESKTDHCANGVNGTVRVVFNGDTFSVSEAESFSPECRSVTYKGLSKKVIDLSPIYNLLLN